MDIGNKIKRLRMKNELTLEELASRSELSKGFLSQVERNLTSPSITTLEDIVEVLGISLADFFKEEKSEQIVFKKGDYYVDEKEEMIITWLVPMAQKNMMEPILYELKPKAKTLTLKPHEGEEFGYVLKGKISIIRKSSSKIDKAKKGETFYLSGDDEHYILNDTDDVVQFIWISTPPKF